MTPVISIRSVSKIYYDGFFKKKTCRALDSISLDVNRGEVLALVGPNGAGKSTLVKTILRLILPTSGEIFIENRLNTDPSVRTSIGYQPERLRYPPGMSCVRLLLYIGSLYGIPAKELPYRVEDALHRVRMEQHQNTKLRHCSKGMLQRIGLAQAILHHPSIVILDEPTDGLDPVGRRELRELINSLRENGTTVIMNSHELSEIEILADRVAFMKNGTIIKINTLSELSITGGFSVNVSETVSNQIAQVISSFAKVQQNRIIEVATAQGLAQLLTILKKESVGIETITTRQQSLEDIFLSLVKDKE